MRTRNQRQKAQTQGQMAETLACWFLRLKGYRILARDYKTPVGEIDIIAARGTVLAFVEVKQRQTRRASLDAISPRQQYRIIRAAGAFLTRRSDLAGRDLRFDVIAINGLSLPHHLQNAWQADPRHWV